MDKTIEIVLAVVVIMVTAAVILFLLQDETGSFSDFLDEERGSSECDLLQSRYENADGDQQQDIEDEINDMDDCSVPS